MDLRKTFLKGFIMRQLMNFAAVFIFITTVQQALAAETSVAKIAGQDLMSGQEKSVSLTEAGKVGTVVVFLSAKCPCSASHEVLLKDLAEKNHEIQFVAIHSNSDEPDDLTLEHFKPVALPFPVIRDEKSKYANEMKALKTPHAFLFNSSGEKVYEGGVTDTHIASNAKHQYLADAITALRAGKKPDVAYGRTLGCVILR